MTWNELFFNQTGAFKKPFLFSIVGQNHNKGEIINTASTRVYCSLVTYYQRLGKVNRTIITLPTKTVLTPDDIYDIYVDFNDDLELDTYIYNLLIRKASC